MLADSITTTDVAIYLGIYATIVSTEAYLVATTKGQMVVPSQDTLETIGVKPSQRREILSIALRNRGRRDARIETVSRVRLAGSWVFGDLVGQVPCDVPAETSKALILGAQGGYGHGEIPTRRFFAIDGAGRVHPRAISAAPRVRPLQVGDLPLLQAEAPMDARREDAAVALVTVTRRPRVGRPPARR